MDSLLRVEAEPAKDEHGTMRFDAHDGASGGVRETFARNTRQLEAR